MLPLALKGYGEVLVYSCDLGLNQTTANSILDQHLKGYVAALRWVRQRGRAAHRLECKNKQTCSYSFFLLSSWAVETHRGKAGFLLKHLSWNRTMKQSYLSCIACFRLNGRISPALLAEWLDQRCRLSQQFENTAGQAFSPIQQQSDQGIEIKQVSKLSMCLKDHL